MHVFVFTENFIGKWAKNSFKAINLQEYVEKHRIEWGVGGGVKVDNG